MATKLMILAAFLVVASAHRFIRPMQNPDLYHGDIAGEGHTRNRNAITSKESRWPNGVVPYKFDYAIRDMVPLIRQAMKQIEDTTCITFERYDGTQPGYVRIFQGEGCYSHWGRTGGQQPISLGDGCEYVGTIVHEILHALGFDHEQNRSDRDDYLIVYYENIEEENIDQFRKLLPHQNWLINDFDFNSIMIYGPTAFSKDGFSKTMVAKKPGITFTEPYEKAGLSPSDIYRINKLYECS